MNSSNSLLNLEVNNEYFKQKSIGLRYSHASQNFEQSNSSKDLSRLSQKIDDKKDEEIKVSSYHSQSV